MREEMKERGGEGEGGKQSRNERRETGECTLRTNGEGADAAKKEKADGKEEEEDERRMGRIHGAQGLW